MRVEKEIVQNLVGKSGWAVTKVSYNNARLSIGIGSDAQIKLSDCEATAHQLLATSELGLLLHNGVEVASTEFDGRSHAVLRRKCWAATCSITSTQEKPVRRQVGILKLSVGALGSPVLQLFSIARRSVILSNLSAARSGIKLLGPLTNVVNPN